MNKTVITHVGNALTIQRTFDAPQDIMWRAWADPEVFAKWWGPRGWETQISQFEFAPGGSMLYGMTCKDSNQTDWFGKTSWGKAVYKTVTPKDEFVYTDYFCDENGTITEGMPATDVSVKLEEVDGKTIVTSVGTYANEEALMQVLAMGMEEGVSQTWDRLGELVEQA